ncbi:MAG: hypothetical protein ACRDEA_07675 [Microcystaceae cyanobacterium]
MLDEIANIHQSLASFIQCPSAMHFRFLSTRLIEYQDKWQDRRKASGHPNRLRIDYEKGQYALYNGDTLLLGWLPLDELMTELGSLIDLFPDQVIG